MPSSSSSRALWRRALAVAAVLAIGATGSVVAAAPAAAATTADFAAARTAWADVLTGGAVTAPSPAVAAAIDRVDDTAAQWSSTVTATGEPWTDLDTSVPADLLEAFRRVKAMATAWAADTAEEHGDATLLARTERALDWLIAQRYNDQVPLDSGTWWFWELGIPIELNDITVLLFDVRSAAEIDEAMDAVEHFRPTVNRTAANRAWAAQVVGLRGIIVQDDAKVTAARDGLTPVLADVTSGDGFYADGSFVQHTYFAYTGGYGVSLLSTISDVLVLLTDTPWEVTAPGLAAVYDWVPRSFDPVMQSGAVLDNVRGREISREATTGDVAGARATRAVLRLAETAPAAERTALRAIAKRWLQTAEPATFWEAGGVTDTSLGDMLVNDSSAAAAPLRGTSAFASMDRAAHHGDDWLFSVSMASKRIASYEVINSQNRRGWYTGDGMTALLTGDAHEYSGDYWATVNPYRLPGTTVDTRVRGDGSQANARPAQDFVGPLETASGLGGVAAMRLAAAGSSLTAQKAWFFFDDEVVAVGSEVTATGQSGTGWNGAPRRVETIIDTRKGDPTVSVTVDGASAAGAPGTPQSFADPGWAHIADGGAGIGYVMPGTAPATALRETRTGTWNAINPNESTSTRTDDYVSLYIDHGQNPTAARYSYIVLPGRTAAQTQAYAGSPDARILHNTAQVSAVREAATGTVGAVFWGSSGGTVSISGTPHLVSNAPGLATTERTTGRATLSYTDPTRSRTSAVSLELKVAASAVVSASAGVTVTQLSPSVKVTVDPTKGPAEIELAVP